MDHRLWVRLSHWIITICFFILTFTGVEIIMVHPRFYWGEVGNDLTPALFEIPISRNYQHGGWEKSVAFYETPNSPISAARTYDIFNQNGWGRSLHFLTAWLLVTTGILYIITGLITGHFRFRMPAQYNRLQRLTYIAVIFLMFPLMMLTGVSMSPAVAAGFPFLLDIFGGVQSARTLHLFSSIILELFLAGHFIMVVISGLKQQIIAMTIGR
jgi:thiosulfate reductase cytochrome b subunit